MQDERIILPSPWVEDHLRSYKVLVYYAPIQYQLPIEAIFIFFNTALQSHLHSQWVQLTFQMGTMAELTMVK